MTFTPNQNNPVVIITLLLVATFLTSCFDLMTDSAVVYSALVDAAYGKSGLISNGKE